MIVVDSDILIALLRGDKRATQVMQTLHEAGDELATTSINMAEVLRGKAASARELAMARRRLRGLTEVPFGPRAARRFAQMMNGLDRVGRPVPELDGMIAAATLEAGARLATWNVRHFDAIPGLERVEE